MSTKPNQMNLIKHTCVILGTMMLSLTSLAQDWCATHTLAEQAIANNPALKQQLDAVWDMPAPVIAESSNKRGRNATYIIPVVFHVVHDNGIGDIPYEQLESAIEVLNEDFRRTNTDASNTRSIFQPYAVDSDIEFRIARVDPDGNCTNGVVRINAPSSTYDARDNVKSVSYWPSNRYLNIWVVNSIRNFSGGPGIVLGYAQFPGFGSWNTYGIVCRNDRLGKFGVGTSVSDGRTLTHEVGHCLNLLHTFQSGCGSSCNSSGDRVCDTPPAFEATYNCNLSQNTCSNDASGSSSVFGGNVVDQIENYMSYDDCQNMFSAGQRDRMHAVLNNTPQLANLISSSNLQATGVLNPQDILCKADFRASARVVCVGQPVSFEDLSFFNPTEHRWEFEKAIPAVSSNQNPTVVFTESGLFDVKLTIKNATDSISTTQTQFIRVLPYPGTAAPLLESFEFGSGSLEENDWYAEDTSDPIYGWEYSTESYTGSNSLVMRQFAADGRTTGINSPAYNLDGLESATVTFYSAYAQRTSSDFDVLRVFYSTTCGENWSIAYAAGGPNLASTSITGSPLVGLTQSDWKLHTFNLPVSALTDQVRFRFEVFSDNGNFIYLDDINITGDLSDIPVLLEPIDGSSSASTDEKLDWKATSVADQYEVWIDVNSNFNTPALQTQIVDYISTNNNGTDSEWLPSNLTLNETYYWRVRTINAGATSDWSETWSFTVSQQAGTGDPTGIDEKSSFDWIVFPNPANEVVKVVPNFDGEASVTITNLQGQVVYQTYTTASANSAIRIETNEFTAGLYILSLESTVSGTVQEKVLIQH